jgi:hypothetical protein
VLPDTLTVDPGGTTTSALVRTNRQMVSTIGEMVPSGVASASWQAVHKTSDQRDDPYSSTRRLRLCTQQIYRRYDDVDIRGVLHLYFSGSDDQVANMRSHSEWFAGDSEVTYLFLG